MPLTLTSPYNFSERILLFGGAGSRKSTSSLEIGRVVPGTIHILDNDESASHARALETEFTDLADRVNLIEVDPTWTSMTAAIERVCGKLVNGQWVPGEANREAGDWVVIDSISSAWEYVQAYVTEQVMGTDIASHLAGLRKASDDLKDFYAKVTETNLWSIIKPEYKNKISFPLKLWKGHLILTAEAKDVGKRDDDQVKSWFKTVGVKPAGETRLPYVPSTLMYLEKNQAGKFKMTTVKDRNRESVERMEFDDFGVDYLMNVAGWTRVKKQPTEKDQS